MSLFGKIYGSTAQTVLNQYHGTRLTFTYIDPAGSQTSQVTAIRISDKLEVEYSGMGTKNVNTVLFAIPKDCVPNACRRGQLKSPTEHWHIREVMADTETYTQVECVKHTQEEYTRPGLRE